MQETEPKALRVPERCDRCGAEAKITLPYGPHRLCAGHFVEFFERRVKRTTNRAGMLRHGEKIAVGVSGGKDSMVTLHLLNEFFGKAGMNEIEAIIIDEGIKGYRDKAVEIAVDYCARNNTPYHVVKFGDELGLDMGKVMAKIHADRSLGSTCSFCGVFRRRFLNRKAIEIGADKLATGHNLDDECQSVAMSIFDNDLTRIARSGETTGEKKKGFVPRIKPLYETPEKEVIAYAAMKGIEHYSWECCPYSWMAKRNHYRKMLNDLEDVFPGTKFKVLEAHRRLRPMLAQHERNNGRAASCCEQCGEPCNGILCGTCRQLARLLGEKAGAAAENRPKDRAVALSCAATKGLGRGF